MSTKINPNAIAEGSISIDKIENLSTRLENIESSAGGGSSNANVQAVDTEDIIDDVNVEYATTAYVDNKVANISLTDYATITYVDGLVGDINSVLESIINGGSVSLITFTIEGTEYQAEEGMTWAVWVDSEYNTDGYYINNSYVSSTSQRNVATISGVVNPNDIIIQFESYDLSIGNIEPA